MEQELRQIVSEVCGIAPDFDRSADLYFTLGVPSMKAMLLLMALEERFGLQIPDGQFVEAVSLEKLAAMMNGLRNGAA